MLTLLKISLISAIITLITGIITKFTYNGIGGKWYCSSIFWFYCTMISFSIWFWDTLILVSWYLVTLNIGG